MSSLTNIKQLDDLTLIEKYKSSKDNNYVGILFERYTHLVFGVCMKYLKDEDEAKDASMIIFEKLMIDLLKHEVQNFKSWLHTVAKNHCLMILRSVKHNIEFIDNRHVENSIIAHQEDKIELENKLTLLEEAIAILDEQQQICIRMFYLEEKSYTQICEQTGFDFNQVKSYIQNGKRNLKIYMLKNE